jgi:acetyl esterase/lipase
MKKQRYYRHFYSVILILSLSFFACSDSVEIEVPNPDLMPLPSAEFVNVPYGEEALQKYDIYLPADRNKEVTKVFVLVHGGGWVGGDKSELKTYVEFMKIQFPTYAIVNINYQLASIVKSPFPMQIDDIKKIILDLKSKADDYEISNQYGFVGISAGAHLSMLYAYAHDVMSEVKMVCSIVGPTNFTDENYSNSSDPNIIENFDLVEAITGVEFEGNKEFYESVSPFHVVDQNAPPTILFYGGQDPLIPTSQGTSLHDKLNELGVINEFTLYENEGHGWVGLSLIDTLNKLNTFINTRF